MNRVSRYINRELFSVFLLTFIVFVVVAASGRFSFYLQRVIEGRFAPDVLFTVVGLRLPEYCQFLLPVSFFIAMMLTIGRLQSDNEYVVLQYAGMTPRRLLTGLAAPMLAITLLVGVLAMVVTPMAGGALSELILEQDRQGQFLNVFPGVFSASADDSTVLYAQDTSEDRAELQDVFIFEQLDDGRQSTTWSSTGRQHMDEGTNARFLVLGNGVRYEGRPGDADYRKVEFATLRRRLPEVSEDEDDDRLSTYPLAELPASLMGRIEWQWRLAPPVFTLIAALLAFGLARVPPRSERFRKIAPGLLMLAIYYESLVVVRRSMVAGDWPELFGLWPIHAVFLAIAVVLISRLSYPAR
jgi:lipopolysaccharide export system permease protein